jgi:hypothetical protein
LQPLRDWFLETLRSEGAVPQRLHAREVAEDGSPEWHREFWRWLTRSPADVVSATERTSCPHPITLGRPDGCGLCGGLGVVEGTVTRWKWPLWRALRNLRRSEKGRRHLVILARIAAGMAVEEGDARAALAAVRARYRG